MAPASQARVAAGLLLAAAVALATTARAQTVNVVVSQQVVLRGSAADLANPTNYKALAYAMKGGQWWEQPTGSPGSPLAANGDFTITTAADAADGAPPSYQLFIVPASFTPPPVQGAAAVPDVIGAAAVRTAAVAGPAALGGRRMQMAPGGAIPCSDAGNGTDTGGGSDAGAGGDAGDGGGGGITTTMVVPPLGQYAAITGKVANLPGPPGDYKGLVLVSSDNGATWWDKTHDVPTGTPQPVPQGIPFDADGAFSFTGWVSDPHDMDAGLVLFVIMPQSFDVTWPTYQVEGVALPDKIKAAAVGSVIVDRATNTATQNTIGGGRRLWTAGRRLAAGKMTVASPPAVGSGGAITGVLSGQTGNAATYQVAVYVEDADGVLWGPKAIMPVAADGTFTIAGWAKDPNDKNAASVTVVAASPDTTIRPIQGGQLPADMVDSGIVAKLTLAGSAEPAKPAEPVTPVEPVQPVTPVEPSPSVTPVEPVQPAGQGMTWPPTPEPTGKVGPANGKITWSGYTWAVKDSGGGAVGPGPNVFVASDTFLWVDSWGLHQHVAPRSGCDQWASTEIILDHKLGYGVYLLRGVGPVETLDPQVTWSPMFLWDDSGNADNGWREVDYEHARWGNGGDPTSSQFVLMPLKNGLVPGWKVRYATSGGKLTIIDGDGQGSGGCSAMGATDFNGAGISAFTHVLRWFNGVLQWATYDGLYTLETVQAAADKLVASYTYPGDPAAVPTEGDTRVHANTWSSNAGAPAWGRTVHTILNGFEFSKQDMDLGIPDTVNVN